MNYIKYIAALFGIALVITAFVYRDQIVDFVTPNKISISASVHVADKKEQRHNPILKHYQPVQLTIENTGDKECELRSEDILLPYHSLKRISKKLPNRIGVFGKFMLALCATGFLLTSTIDCPIEFVVCFLGCLYITTPTLVGCLISRTIKTQKNRYVRKEIQNSIFEPRQTLIISAHSIITKTLFCPKNELPESFEVTTTESETGKQNTVQLSLAKTL